MSAFKVVRSEGFSCSFGPKTFPSGIRLESKSLSLYGTQLFPPSFLCHHIPDQHLSLHLTLSLTQWVWREEAGSSVHRSSHHLWNFRARPRWKGALCPPDEECPCVARQRKGFIWPGICRNLEKCREDFLGGGDGKAWTGEEEASPTAIPKLW